MNIDLKYYRKYINIFFLTLPQLESEATHRAITIANRVNNDQMLTLCLKLCTSRETNWLLVYV